MNILKPKLLHFSEEFSYSEIIDYLKDKKNEVFYFTRFVKENNEFHLIRYNENGKFQVNMLESQLLKYYEKIPELLPLLKNTKIKGNSNFAIIENINPKLLEKLKVDLNNLLNK